MSSARQGTLPALLGLLGLVGLTAVIGLQIQLRLPYPDIDQFFHFAFSRLTLESLLSGGGLIGTLPQLPFLGWEQKFSDKEFLFHLFSTFGYWLGEERGVQLTSLAIGVGLVLLLWSAVRSKLSAIPAVALVLCLVLLDFHLPYRIFLVRAFPLAICCFTGICIGLMKDSSRWVLLGAFFFPWCYHAIYLPLALLLAALVGSFILGSQLSSNWRKISALGLVALVLGVITNPYFPGYLTHSLNHLLFALPQSDITEFPVGHEIRPLSFTELFARSPLIWLLLAVSVTVFARAVFRSRALLFSEQAFWLAGAIGTALLTLMNPRGHEYFLPLSAASSAISLATLTSAWRNSILALLLVLGVGLNYGKYQQLFESRQPILESNTAALITGVMRLPQEGSGRIFNCTFNEGSPILHFRPSYQFLDILDPRFLMYASPDLHRARLEIIWGRSSDPFSDIRQKFGADFVTCYDRPVINQLLKDSRARLLFPTDRDLQTFKQPRVAVFDIREQE